MLGQWQLVSGGTCGVIGGHLPSTANPSLALQSTYQIDLKKRQFDLVQEHELSKSEDAPMTLAVDYSVRSC